MAIKEAELLETDHEDEYDDKDEYVMTAKAEYEFFALVINAEKSSELLSIRLLNLYIMQLSNTCLEKTPCHGLPNLNQQLEPEPEPYPYIWPCPYSL